MRKIHLIILIIACITVIFTAYSLIILNQVIDMDFDWYSGLNASFVSQKRAETNDSYNGSTAPKLQFMALTNKEDIKKLEEWEGSLPFKPEKLDFANYIYLYASYDKVNSPEYRLKFSSLAQRINVIEVKIDINTPEKLSDINSGITYKPFDLIRINKYALKLHKIYFVVKNQSGKQLDEVKINIY